MFFMRVAFSLGNTGAPTRRLSNCIILYVDDIVDASFEREVNICV